jgi:hypothetical protein
MPGGIAYPVAPFGRAQVWGELPPPLLGGEVIVDKRKDFA